MSAQSNTAKPGRSPPPPSAQCGANRAVLVTNQLSPLPSPEVKQWSDKPESVKEMRDFSRKQGEGGGSGILLGGTVTLQR